MLSQAILWAIPAMSAGVSTDWPSTESAIGLQAPCDFGQTKAAIDGRGEASHSPQPVSPPAATRTSSASWLPSPASVTSGMAT
ncbi:MAG: hypothetical protein R3D25_10870 [Geminicoccaceae bacterium]